MSVSLASVGKRSAYPLHVACKDMRLVATMEQLYFVGLTGAGWCLS